MLQLKLSYALYLKMAVFDRLFQIIHYYGLGNIPHSMVDITCNKAPLLSSIDGYKSGHPTYIQSLERGRKWVSRHYSITRYVYFYNPIRLFLATLMEDVHYYICGSLNMEDV